VLQSVFLHLLRGFPDKHLDLDDNVKQSTDDLLRVGKQIIIEGNLDKNECEVLYGRCGYLHAILFIRKHLSLPSYGQDIALTIIDQVLETGTRNAASVKDENDFHNTPLLWVWHGKVYLGACHGISGILYTLLHFLTEIEMLSNQRGVDILNILKSTLDKINETQIFSSTANLASSYGSQR
jgi:lantibiotic modifying enzyme